MEDTERAKRRDKLKYKQRRNETDADKSVFDLGTKRKLGNMEGKKEDERRKKKRKLQFSDIELGQEKKFLASKVSQCLVTGRKMKKEMNRTELELRSKEEAASNVATDSIASLELVKLIRDREVSNERESGHCVALLGESLRALLFFLEVMVELSFERKQSFSELGIQATMQCASWLRRVYEEVAEHKIIFGSYITHVLSDYACIISGYGMSIKGLSREVEATLRPSAFALVDICSTDDLQQLHAVLGEGLRRSTLTALRREYEQHFKYTEKV